jgi:glucose/arabinose dehydrogenase
MLTHHALANQSPSGNGQAPTHMPRRTLLIGGALVTLLASSAGLPGVARAATVANPLCPAEVVFFAPGTGQDITVPPGFTVSVFASGLNAPTGIAFAGNKNNFQVYVLESGHGLPSQCNDETTFPGSAATNPFTPDILVFDKNGKKIAGPLGKPTDPTTVTGGTNVFQPHGPAIDIAFERGLQGGRLFATDSNQSTHTGTSANSSRIVTVDPTTGAVTPFITGLPTGDHPTEQLAFSGGWVYWSQGSTTNSGVVGLDNGSGTGQPDIPCQDITLSDNVFVSSLSPLVETSGYSLFGHTNPGGKIPAFFNASTDKVRQGVCDGATLRAKLDDPTTIEVVGWGHRNGYAIRFAPNNHPLAGQLLVGEDGPDERGARPSNGAPEVLSVDQQNADGTPVYHGWPDRYGFLAASQAVFNPIGGPSDDLCVFDASNPPSFCTPASLANILKFAVPIADVLAFPPAPIVAPVAIEAADSSFTGIDFVPSSFVGGPVLPGAALYSLEGDFGFSPPNATAPAPEVGHEVKLINFNQDPSAPLSLSFQNFARNATGDQAFISATNTAAFNRPTNVRFGPDGCAYVVDYGAVRDGGGGPGGDTRFVDPADAPLVQFPGTGVIWKICPSQ